MLTGFLLGMSLMLFQKFTGTGDAGEHTNTRLNWAVGIGMIPPPRGPLLLQ